MVQMIQSPSMPPKTAKLLRELKRWCDLERGRRVQVAKLLKVAPPAISNLFSGRQQLTGEQALAIREFLDKQRSEGPQDVPELR